MFKKLLVGFSLFLFSIITLAEPLKYPFKFEDLKNALGADGFIELTLPKLENFPTDGLTRYEVKEIPDNPNFVIVRLHLDSKRPLGFHVKGDVANNIPSVQFYYGYGTLNAVRMAYDFSNETTRTIAIDKIDETKRAFIANLEHDGYSHTMFLFGDMIKDAVRVTFSELDYMRSQVLYATITNDQVTERFTTLQDTNRKEESLNLNHAVYKVFR
jgi:hypothetical protein